MHKRLIGALLGGLLLAACGSGPGGGNPDVLVGYRPDTSIPIPADTAAAGDTAQAGPDAGCDEDAMTENSCIINPPGSAQGGGTAVARQNPVSWQTCKLQ